MLRRPKMRSNSSFVVVLIFVSGVAESEALCLASPPRIINLRFRVHSSRSASVTQPVRTGTHDCSNSHHGDGLHGRARHSVRAFPSQAPQDRRARSDAPYQPGKMRIAGMIQLSIAKAIVMRQGGGWRFGTARL